MSNPYGWGQNEPQIKPKDQGGDSISTFAAKIKDAITSLFNTLNSYPWSNATQSASGYMSKEDKAALDNVPSTYLPLSGGTLTGVLNTKDIYIDNAAIRAKADTQATVLYGGVGWAHGAQGIFYGKDDATLPGGFAFRADNGTISKTLVGSTDGTLTWDGKSIVNNGAFKAMYFSQTSGSYTAPYTGVYRITLKSGGGGGGAAGDSYKYGGGGGGEGGTVTFYKTLTKAQSYAYVIGAGGTAAPNVTDSGLHNGSDGGASSFNGEYTIYGGKGGRNAYSSNRGGDGGQTGSFPVGAVVYITPGQMGQAGSLALNTGYGGSPASGGGGGSNAYGRGGEGAYFSGGAAVQATDGKDGFILIEYAE